MVEAHRAFVQLIEFGAVGSLGPLEMHQGQLRPLHPNPPPIQYPLNQLMIVALAQMVILHKWFGYSFRRIPIIHFLDISQLLLSIDVTLHFPYLL